MHHLSALLVEKGFSYDKEAATFYRWHKGFPVLVTYKKVASSRPSRMIYSVYFSTSVSKKDGFLRLSDLPLEEEFVTGAGLNCHLSNKFIAQLWYSGKIKKDVANRLLEILDLFLDYLSAHHITPVCSHSGLAGQLDFYLVDNQAIILSTESFQEFSKKAQHYQLEHAKQKEHRLRGFAASFFVFLGMIGLRMAISQQQLPSLFLLLLGSPLLNWVYIKGAGTFKERSQWIPRIFVILISIIVILNDFLDAKGLSWTIEDLEKGLQQMEWMDGLVMLMSYFLCQLGWIYFHSHYKRLTTKHGVARLLVNN